MNNPSLHWKQPNYFLSQELPSTVRQWLLYPNSMTKQLKQASLDRQSQFKINILNEGLGLLSAKVYEQKIFSCRLVYSREVQIFSGSTILMYAHSVMPKTETALIKRRFRGLGFKPLGEILFEDKTIDRSPFNVTKIYPASKEYHLATMNQKEQPFVWSRQSYFSQKQQPFLLLTEYFSPNLFTFLSGPVSHDF